MPERSLEERLGLLVDDKELTRRRKSAEHTFRDLDSGQIDFLRRRAKNDLFFLATGPLEYELLSTKIHGHLAKWLERTRGHQYRLLLLPRGHYKSTICTIAESIQMALPNVANVQDWPYCLGPDIKLLLAHENRESASRFLVEIAEAFMAKPLMLALFPECIPVNRVQRINKWELELPRTAHHKEPTFDTIGAGGAAQGRHYNWLKLDDLVGEDARDSVTVMQRVQDWFDNANSLLTRVKVDGWDLIGTRWSMGDVYGHAQKLYGVDKAVSVLRAYSPKDVEDLPEGRLAAYVRGALEGSEPIFPEEFDLPFLNILRKNRRLWAAQYANNPRDSELVEFDPRWLRYYNVKPDGTIIVFAGERSWSLHPRRDLDICILVDPSLGERDKSDESGIIVTGTDSKLNVYLLETIKRRLKPPELVDLLFGLYIKWNPRLISIEEVAFSAMFRYWIEEKGRTLRLHPTIYPYKPGSKRSKEGRIRGLTNYFAAGQVFISEGMHDFRDEFETFPLGESDHLLDALAQGPEVWTPSRGVREMESHAKLEEKLLDMRDAVTGY